MRMSRRMAINAKRQKKFEISYSGNYTDTIITDGGVQYRLLTLISSGVLTVTGNAIGDISMCGGGAAGENAENDGIASTRGGRGGAGAYIKEAYGIPILGGPVVVGAQSGKTSYLGYEANGATGPNGGTGGGQGGSMGGNYSSAAGTGDGISKKPLSMAALGIHCAGGGGGAYFINTIESNCHGGAGGSNGSNGLARSKATDNTALGGVGGDRGGGAGGNSSPSAVDGSPATFYGGGGGGGGAHGMGTKRSGAAGYQGVCYIRIRI